MIVSLSKKHIERELELDLIRSFLKKLMITDDKTTLEYIPISQVFLGFKKALRLRVWSYFLLNNILEDFRNFLKKSQVYLTIEWIYEIVFPFNVSSSFPSWLFIEIVLFFIEANGWNSIQLKVFFYLWRRYNC